MRLIGADRFIGSKGLWSTSIAPCRVVLLLGQAFLHLLEVFFIFLGVLEEEISLLH